MVTHRLAITPVGLLPSVTLEYVGFHPLGNNIEFHPPVRLYPNDPDLSRRDQRLVRSFWIYFYNSIHFPATGLACSRKEQITENGSR